MESSQIIISSILFFFIASLIAGLIIKSKQVKNLKEQLKNIRGNSGKDLEFRGRCIELGLMSSGITHEINNSLTVILGLIIKLSKLELRMKDGSGVEKELAQIKVSTEKIASVVKSFREYIYRTDEELEEYISLSDMMNEILLFYDQRLKNHGIELRIKNIDKIYLSGHKRQFEQALMSLISNSFDSIDKLEEKWIEIWAKKKEERVQIFVRDSSHGIPSEMRSQVLNSFVSAKNKKDNFPGLSLVKEITQKHGGKLRYIEDDHTTLMMELPKASSEQYHH